MRGPPDRRPAGPDAVWTSQASFHGSDKGKSVGFRERAWPDQPPQAPLAVPVRAPQWLFRAFGINNVRELPKSVLRLIGAGLLPWDGQAPPGETQRIGVDGVFEAPSPSPYEIEQGPPTNATSFQIPSSDQLFRGQDGKLYKEMELAVRPDVRLTTADTWVTFRGLSFLYPQPLVLVPEDVGEYRWAGQTQPSPVTEAENALALIVDSALEPVAGTSLTRTPPIVWHVPVATVKFRKKCHSTTLDPRSVAKCPTYVEEVVLGAELEIEIETYAAAMQVSLRDTVLARLKRGAQRQMAISRMGKGKCGSAHTLEKAVTEDGSVTSPLSTSRGRVSPARSRLGKEDTKDRWTATDHDGAMTIPSKGFYLHLRARGGPPLDERRIRRGTLEELYAYLRAWRQKLYKNSATWRVLTVKASPTKPLRAMVCEPLFVPPTMELAAPVFAPSPPPDGVHVPGIPPPSHAAQHIYSKVRMPDALPDHFRTLAVLATVVISLAPTENLVELVTAPQPPREIGFRRARTHGSVTEPLTRSAEPPQRIKLDIPVDLLRSEVRDLEYLPSVLGQEVDALFDKATQFRLRSQLTAEIGALISLPSDQIHLGKLRYLAGSLGSSSCVLVDVAILHSKVVNARSNVLEVARKAAKVFGVPMHHLENTDMAPGITSPKGRRKIDPSLQFGNPDETLNEYREDMGSTFSSPRRGELRRRNLDPKRAKAYSAPDPPKLEEPVSPTGNRPSRKERRDRVAGTQSLAKKLIEEAVKPDVDMSDEETIRDEDKHQSRSLLSKQLKVAVNDPWKQRTDMAEHVVSVMMGGLTQQRRTEVTQDKVSTRWHKALQVAASQSDPVEVFKRMEKALTLMGQGTRASRHPLLFPMLSRAVAVDDQDARGLHLHRQICVDKLQLARHLDLLAQSARTPEQQRVDDELDRIRQDSRGLESVIFSEVSGPEDMWTAVRSVGEVINKLRASKKNTDMCEKCIRALTDAMQEDPAHQDEIRVRGGMERIMEAMRLHNTHVGVQERGICAITQLMESENDYNVRTLSMNSVIPLVVQVMETFPQVELIHEKGCRSLLLLYERPLESKQVRKMCAIQMQTHANAEIGIGVQRDGALDVLRNAASLPASLLKIAIKSGRQLWPQKENVVANALGAVASITQTNAEVEIAVEFHGVEFITEAMHRFRDSRLVQLYACRAMRSLTGHSNSRILYVIRSTGAIAGLTAAMAQFPEDAEVQEFGCQTISSFVASPPCVHCVFEKEGVLSIVRALARHRAKEELQAAGCRAIGHICARVGAETMERHEPVGPVHEVALAMVAHANDASVQAAAFRALDLLCPTAAETIRQLGGVSAVMPPLFWRPKDLRLDLEACKETLCMSDDLEVWCDEVYPVSVRNCAGWSDLAVSKGTPEQVSELVVGLERAQLAGQWYCAHALGVFLCYLAWHSEEYAETILQAPGGENDVYSIFVYGAFQQQNLTSSRISVRALGHLLRAKSGGVIGRRLISEGDLDILLKFVGGKDPVLRRTTLMLCARLVRAVPESAAKLLEGGLTSPFWKSVRAALLDQEMYVRKAAGAFMLNVMLKVLELPDFLEHGWHCDLVAHTADSPGETRLPGVILLGQLAENEDVARRLQDEYAHRALKEVLLNEEGAYMRTAAAKALTAFARHMCNEMVTENIVPVALRLAMQPLCGEELYSACVELFIVTVELCESVSLLTKLVSVRARTQYGMLRLPTKLVKRLVYRIEFVLENNLGSPAELSRYELSRVLPASIEDAPEAVDVRAAVERLLQKCPRIGDRFDDESP